MMSRDAGPASIYFTYFLLAAFLGVIPSCLKSPEPQEAQKPAAGVSESSVPQAAPAKAERVVEPAAKKAEQPEPPKLNDPSLVPIVIQLPKPMFIGTPQNIAIENLEKPLGRPRPPFLAPVGTTNVALGKRVTSSDNSPIIGEVECITDGNKDSSDGNYVQLSPGVQHITIDLRERCEIYAVVVWHLHKQPVVFFDVVVQAADDASFIENVKILFNNDTDNSAGLGIGKNMNYTETNEGKLIDAKSVRARYVRLYSNGYSLDDSNYYTEVEVYGKSIK
jgi:hypothetical protein